MSYRDDHEAALARVVALEDEVTRLRRERKEAEDKAAGMAAGMPGMAVVGLPAVTMGRSRAAMAAIGLVAAIGGGVLAVKATNAWAAHRATPSGVVDEEGAIEIVVPSEESEDRVRDPERLDLRAQLWREYAAAREARDTAMMAVSARL